MMLNLPTAPEYTVALNEWTGRLYSNWNGTYVHAQALAAEAIGDPYGYAFL